MRDSFFFIIGLILALALTMVTSQGGHAVLNPPWVLMVLCAWIMLQKKSLAFLLPFSLGLIMDVMLGSPLGAHALAMIVPILTVLMLFKSATRCGFFQKAVMIVVLTMMYQLILVCIYGFMGMSPASYHYFLSPLTAMVVWMLMTLSFSRVKK